MRSLVRALTRRTLPPRSTIPISPRRYTRQIFRNGKRRKNQSWLSKNCRPRGASSLFFTVCEVRDDVDSDRQAVSNPVNACEGVARSGSIVRQLKGIFSSPLCHPTCRFCLFVFPVPIVNRATAHFAARCPRQEVFRSDSRVFDATGESWKGKTVSRSPIGYRISDYAYANADCVKERSHFFFLFLDIYISLYLSFH